MLFFSLKIFVCLLVYLLIYECVSVRVYGMCVRVLVEARRRKALDALGLELQVVVSRLLWLLRTELWKNSKCSLPLSRFSLSFSLCPYVCLSVFFSLLLFACCSTRNRTKPRALLLHHNPRFYLFSTTFIYSFFYAFIAYCVPMYSLWSKENSFPVLTLFGIWGGN